MPQLHGDAAVGRPGTRAGCQDQRRYGANRRRAYRHADEISSRHGLRIHCFASPMVSNYLENTVRDRPKRRAAGCRPMSGRRRRYRWPDVSATRRRSRLMCPYSSNRSTTSPLRPRKRRRAGLTGAGAPYRTAMAIAGVSSRRKEDASSRLVTLCNRRKISFAVGRSDAHRIADQGPARIVARHGQVLARHIGATTRRPGGIARCQECDCGDARDRAEDRRTDGVSFREHCRICSFRRG